MRKNTYIQTVIMVVVTTSLRYGANAVVKSVMRRVKK